MTFEAISDESIRGGGGPIGLRAPEAELDDITEDISNPPSLLSLLFVFDVPFMAFITMRSMKLYILVEPIELTLIFVSSVILLRLTHSGSVLVSDAPAIRVSKAHLTPQRRVPAFFMS